MPELPSLRLESRSPGHAEKMDSRFHGNDGAGQFSNYYWSCNGGDREISK